MPKNKKGSQQGDTEDVKKPAAEVLEPSEAEAPANLVEEETAEVKEEGELETDAGELRKEMEKMDLDEVSNKQAQAAAQTIASQQEEEKIKSLLALAKGKGVIYAIKVAQKMNDAYILDQLHDRLIQEGMYKK